MWGNWQEQPGALRLMRAGVCAALVAACSGMALGAPGGAQAGATYRGVLQIQHFDVSPVVRDLPVAPPVDASQPGIERRSDLPTGNEGSFGPQDRDPVVQRQAGTSRDIPGTLVSFNGVGSTGAYPPDTNGEVGPNHYVQMVNTRYAVFDKSGAILAGPFNINTLWSGFGGACQTENAGDPVVVYDQFSDRWILMQFTAAGPTYYLCVALSTTADPTGTFYRWAFSTGSNFPDYPKFAVWGDAYLASTREFAGGPFAGVGAYAFNKAQMVAGNPSPTVISFLTGTSPSYAMGDGLLPADVDGWTLPPAGSPAYFIGSQDNGGPYGAPSDALNIWTLNYNFTDPPSSSLSLSSTVAVTAFDSVLDLCGGTRNCVPQPGTTQRIDHQGYRQRVLHRAAYRNFGTYETFVTNQSVEATTNMSGIRWYEVRNPGSGASVYQQGTYAPGATDGIHRWFGSIAQNKYGDMALGYSVSDGTSTYPGIRYTGRLAGDTLGLLPQGEGVIVNGGGSQTGSAARWGDYSSMTVDPADDCTFWYTTEYYATTSSTGWSTRIGSFKFPNCKVAGGAQRVFVATTGSDANAASNCPPTAPCRTFQAAVDVVNTGGEIIALDSGGFGPVVVNRSMKLISAPGALGSISVPQGNGITIGTPGVEVVLRGITVNGTGGDTGIYINGAASVSIERCVVSNFSTGSGIFVSGAISVAVADTLVRDSQVGLNARDGAKVTVSKSQFLGNIANGILAYGYAAGTETTVDVSRAVVSGGGADWGVSAQSLWPTAAVKLRMIRSSVSGSDTGVAATAGGTTIVSLGRNQIVGNVTGLYRTGASAVMRSLGNNLVNDNGTNVSGGTSALPPL